MIEELKNLKQLRRVRRKKLPGSSYTGAERDVALLLMNTYRLEYLRHLNNQKIEVGAFKPRTWEDDLDPPDLQVISDNIEENTRHQRSQFWYQLAREVIRRQIDPERFIRSRFVGLSAAAKPPSMNSLNTDRSFREYAITGEMLAGELSKAFDFQRVYARNTMRSMVALYRDRSKESVWVDVLEDDDRPMTALFRYCLAYSLAATYPVDSVERSLFVRVMGGYRAAAACQYVRASKAYDQVWGSKWIPAAFKKQAQVIYNKIYRGQNNDEPYSQ